LENIFIILSGGPGVYDPKDPETHDQSWDNFVTPPLLRSSKAPIHDAKTEAVHWLIYEPAYTARWASDVANQKTAPAQHQHTVNIKTKYKLPNYLELLKKRATERDWKYQGISSASGFLSYVGGLKGTKISRMWFFGHARDDLWLSLDHHPQDHEAIQPESTAVLSVANIDKLKAFSFTPQKTAIFTHKFFGCNTKAFAQKWSRNLGVYAEGAEGKVDFARIHANGGKVTLSPRAQWVQYSNAGTPVRLPLKPGDDVS
jgi:hypothetical protein